jgi:23S rRNA (cytosine1962-C5)-methyltransferase
MASYPVIRLRAREGRRVRAGAPWVFSNEVTMSEAAKMLAPGSIVNVAGDDGREFGTFYFNPKSLIAARQLDRAAGADIDAAFLEARLKRTLALREQIYARPFYRLVHAEGDLLPGLVVDRFGDTLSVQIATAGMEALTEPLLEALDRVLAPEAVILRNDVPARTLEGLDSYVRVVKGAPARVTVEESAIRYFADLASGQKTGWYYDQRDNRAFAASFAKGKSVLDAYCYTGGFALAAAEAGARECVGLDGSAPALALAEESAAANRLMAKFVKCDVFEELERLSLAKETFDVMIADPPPFVRARKDLETGAKAYRKLARLAAGLVAPQGILLLASCSHNMPAERFALECALGIARAGRSARLIRQSGAGADHPIHPMLPESAYLKLLAYALD